MREGRSPRGQFEGRGLGEAAIAASPVYGKPHGEIGVVVQQKGPDPR